jgi:uncharacterized protein
VKGFTPVPFTQVEITGDFWRERLETVLSITVPSQYEQLRRNGILESLELKQPAPALRIPHNNHNFTTQIFWDSDIGKWIEVAGNALSHRRDPIIETAVDGIIDLMAKGQAGDGYMNFWYLGREPEKRWSNLRDNHELYCAGHILEGAIAYFQATGKRKLLDCMLRYVDHIASIFGPGTGQKRGYCGHQEIEIALIKLYRLLGDRKHLGLAAYFINERGAKPHYFDEEARARGEDPKNYWARTYEYNQSHMPVRAQTKVVGHAVRAMYMYTAMADLAVLLNDNSLRKACKILWKDVIATKMYLTAGLGPSAKNEGFTADFDLPNETAYAETCASVALIFWAQRMLHFDLEGTYAEVLERSLFNGALAGLSRDGRHYFYENPLESDGHHQRWAWHHCPCCTMNVSRLVASIGGYLFSQSATGIAVHLYGGATLTTTLKGKALKIIEESNYPWSGEIKFKIDVDGPTTFDLCLRIPEWAKSPRLRIDGKPFNLGKSLKQGYVKLSRKWSSGDTVNLSLPMPPERVYAHPFVKADVSRVALRRGPLVYCLEQTDNPASPIAGYRLYRDSKLSVSNRKDLFSGIATITTYGGRVSMAEWGGILYRPKPPKLAHSKLTAVPYYLWSNREKGPMAVWIPEA